MSGILRGDAVDGPLRLALVVKETTMANPALATTVEDATMKPDAPCEEEREAVSGVGVALHTDPSRT